MKLNNKEFKRFKELEQKVKAKKATTEEKQEYDELKDKRNQKDESPKFTPGNDFSWWSKLPELVRDSASFKCNWVPGLAIAPNEVTEVGVGVMEVELDSVCGSSVAVTDAVNVWSRDLYLKMFQKYRPASGYTAADLGITILAALDIVKLIALYERIYGIVNRYSRLNVNMPSVEMVALGLTTAEVNYIQGHLSDFRYDLNYLIRKAQRLCILKDLSVVADAISLFGYEYMDHESVRSQLILFTTKEFGLYSDIALTTGGSIEYVDMSSGLFDFSANNMCKFLEQALNAVLGSDSVQRIFADLVVWFGQEAMLQFVPVPEDYVVAPVKSESILHKLHNLEMSDINTYRLTSFLDSNLTPADAGYVTGKHMIYQVDDRIVTALTAINVPSGATTGTSATTLHGIRGQWVCSSASAFVGTVTKGHVIDTAHNDITPEIIIEGSLFKRSASYYFDAGANLFATIINNCAFYLVRNIRLHATTYSTGNLSTISYTTSAAAATAGYLACVDWAPLCFVISSTDAIDRIFGEYDNIVYASNADLNRIHRTIVLSGIETSLPVINK